MDKPMQVEQLIDGPHDYAAEANLADLQWLEFQLFLSVLTSHDLDRVGALAQEQLSKRSL
jgi:hypothetical protein